jgi:urease accessory protein
MGTTVVRERTAWPRRGLAAYRLSTRSAGRDARRNSALSLLQVPWHDFRNGFVMNAPVSALRAARTVAAPDSAAGWCAELELAFGYRRGRSVMLRNRHVGPLRVQKPLYPEGGAVCHAIVLHPPAGIVGGDRLSIDVSVGAGAHVLLTTPGAGKWYRSGGRVAALTQTLRVAGGGVCEWLPQESIVFDGAQGELATEVALEPGAGYIGFEMLCFGRTASGERFGSGALALGTRVSVAGRPVWRERGRVEGGSALLGSVVGLRGEPVVATLLVVGPGVDEALRDACREIVAAAGEGAVTLLPGVLVARWLGPACEPGRVWLARLLEVIRPAVAGVPMRTPRVWMT